ncbi:MAG: hypothetical protein K8T91_17795 [Planctomycetes bacterium]|nr:hypothetical protein [Planctomycetota bacterium]
MSDELSLDIRGSLSWLRQESLPLSTVADAARLEYAVNLSDGDGAGEVDALWHGEIELAAAAQQDLDLTNLTMTMFGDTISVDLAAVKAMLIVNTATEAGDDLLIGGAGSGGDAWAGPWNNDQDAKQVVAADSAALLVNRLEGWPVTAGSANVLRIKNNGAGPITARIVIAGVAD